jgi:hypothetical protein
MRLRFWGYLPDSRRHIHEKGTFQIQRIPSIVWGEPSGNLYLFIHGQGGCKEEAESFAKIAGCYGWQVLSLDLLGHGERKEEKNTFDPWHIVPELLVEILYGAKDNLTEYGMVENFAKHFGCSLTVMENGEHWFHTPE